MKKIINFIKLFFSNIFGLFRGGSEKALTIEKFWKIELIVAGILLIMVVGFDVWTYRTITTGIDESNLPDDIEGFVPLNKFGLDEAYSAIETRREFLENPSYPILINDPF